MFTKLVFTKPDGTSVVFHSHEIVWLAHQVMSSILGQTTALDRNNNLDEMLDMLITKAATIFTLDMKDTTAEINLLLPIILPNPLSTDPDSIDKWLSVIKYLYQNHKNNLPIMSWWIVIGGRLIRVNNKESLEHKNYPYFVSDHGHIPNIIAPIREAIFNDNIPWLSSTFPYKTARVNSTYQLKAEQKKCQEYVRLLHKKYGEMLKSPMLNHMLHGHTAIQKKILVLGELIKAINKGEYEPLFRPIDAYGSEHKGDSYRSFATTLHGYFQQPKKLSSTQLAAIMRHILKGHMVNNENVSFLPNLTATWFLAEPARNPRSFLSSLMLLDMLESGISLAYGDSNGYSWVHTLIHPQKKTGDEKIQDLYGEEVKVDLFDGSYPMAHDGSASHARQGFNSKSRLNNLQQKEGSLCIHWIASSFPSAFPNYTVKAVQFTEEPLLDKDQLSYDEIQSDPGNIKNKIEKLQRELLLPTRTKTKDDQRKSGIDKFKQLQIKLELKEKIIELFKKRLSTLEHMPRTVSSAQNLNDETKPNLAEITENVLQPLTFGK
jgi:hypothetical protein